MADLAWNNPMNKPASYIKTDTADNQESRLVRLVEDPDIIKNIEFDEISVKYDGFGNEGGTNSTEQTSLPGAVYPMIRINDRVFCEEDIQYVNISSDGFLPTIDVYIKMANELFIEKDMPKDGDIISTFIRTNTNAINYLRNDFVITSCSTSTSKYTSINVSGKLLVPGLDARYNGYAFIGTSKDVLKNIAKKFNIGFATNDFDNTNDFQNWICTGDSYKFIADITSHSWKNNTSFFKSWIDLYYDLCFVNVNKFLLSTENTEDEIDITTNSLTMQFQTVTHVSPDADDAKLSLKVFSNIKSMRGSPFYIKKWYQTNNSAEVSLEEGYSNETLVYRHNANLFAENADKCLETLTNIPAYDQAKTDSYMLLRGRSKYSKNLNPDDEQARVNYDFSNTYMNKEWYGVEYVLNDTDTDKTSNNTWSGNVHKNYNRSEMHNQINNAELEKMYITIECDGLCLQVMRGERVPVIIQHDLMATKGSIKSDKQSENTINKMYSGFYFVDSVSYTYNQKMKDPDVHSKYTTTLVLKRREWPTPERIEIDKQDYSGDIIPDTKQI